MLMRWDDANDDPLTAQRVARLRELQRQALTATTIPALMGVEGSAAAAYFHELGRRLEPPWTFTRRLRRPPPDPVNCLLSITYTLLHHCCVTAIEAAGLDPAAGFLHGIEDGRASLAADLMEEFRPLIADSVTLLLCNKRILEPDDFATSGRGVELRPHAWGRLADQFERRLETMVTVPGRKTRTTYRKLLEVQARRLRAAIEGTAEAYVPFRMR
jgi:CRISPR-associated protein Cas1